MSASVEQAGARAAGIAVAIGALLVAGCSRPLMEAETGPPADLEDATAAAVQLDPTTIPGFENAWTTAAPRSPAGANGLEVVTWMVLDTDDRVSRTLERLVASDSTSTGEQRRRWREVGLHAASVPIDDLREIFGDLGGVAAALSTWHGPVLQWSPIARTTIDPRTIRAPALPPNAPFDRVELLTRAWAEPTLDGARFRLEIVPRFAAPIGPLGSLTRRRDRDELVFPALRRTWSLDDRTAVIICSTESFPKPALPVQIDVDAPDTPGVPDDPDAPPAPPPPDARLLAPPLDLGTALLATGGSTPRRTLLVLVPRVPDSFFPEPGRSERADPEPTSAPAP